MAMKDRGEATRTTIKNALLKIVENKESTKKITVAQILNAADVARGTFYTYYNNVDDTFADLAMDFARRIIRFLRAGKNAPGINGYHEAYRQLLTYMFEHKNVFKALFNNKQFENINISVVSEFLYQQYTEEFPNEDPGVLEYSALASTNFVYSMMRKWAKEGFQQSVDEMTDILFGALKLAVKLFLPKSTADWTKDKTN